MAKIDINRNELDGISRLLEMDESAGFWQNSELGDILEHQLNTPLHADIPFFAVKAGLQELKMQQPAGPRAEVWTYGDLFEHADPPLKLLKLCKNFAKHSRMSCGGSLPDEVAGVIYYAAIAAALVHKKLRITSLSDTEMKKGFRWALSRTWLSTEMRRLFAEADN